MNRPRFLVFAGFSLLALLTGCSSSGNDSMTASVAITTVTPTRHSFHDSISAWGRAVADSRHQERLELPHAGRIDALSVIPGEAVSKGQALLRMHTDPTARQAYRQAEHDLTLARGHLQRMQKLFREHLATREQVASAQRQRDDAQAAMQAQRALGNGQTEYVLRAPGGGVVTALHVERGQYVAADALLLDFTPGADLRAQLGVPPDLATRIHVGMPVQLRPVYGKHGSHMGTVDMVGHAIDPSSGLVPVWATIPADIAARWAVGSPISARIQTTQFVAWAVPREAVLEDKRGHYLFQASKGHAHRVDVKVVQPDGDTVGVRGKLDAHLPVIVAGAYELSDGDAVRKAGS
ncbi:efflux RND transporter periplasmic adaptor subunit [Oleiagrimonas soli]|uniref:RND family efflux transporter MFP subunit n=1 Tax=Oleiagrimonas soli TaxID=1543381 RepID=A0A099CWM0_9GAMM|nr:efflux RND transporter periplasmic adaptor subunit [Oleiagrimonas soli]KGI78046.1 hypothetical protein LF63_0106650 [Oleiagrimonas soli]MBB6183555.1 RND family efflux transporter MFP subunit [Oleiagrimonas soli]